MRRVILSEFVSLDGVFEASDQWHFPYFDDEMGQEIVVAMGQSDAMLMGRVNYEEWAAFWPQQDAEENPAASHMNGVRKYVVSTTLKEPLEWPDPDRTPTSNDCSAMLLELHDVLRSYPGELPMLGADDIPRGLEALAHAGDFRGVRCD
jgi:dihydrofolate reductase